MEIAVPVSRFGCFVVADRFLAMARGFRLAWVVLADSLPFAGSIGPVNPDFDSRSIGRVIAFVDPVAAAADRSRLNCFATAAVVAFADSVIACSAVVVVSSCGTGRSFSAARDRLEIS